MKPDEQRAFDFANWAHCGQVRKYTGEPYIVHPAEVVRILRTVPHDRHMICAAWMHDVIEDTLQHVSRTERIALMLDQFIVDIVTLVIELSDVTTLEDGNRSARKEIELRRIQETSVRAKTVKLADLISNSESVHKYDEGFARVYVLEKRELLDRALRQGDPNLWGRAANIANDFIRRAMPAEWEKLGELT